MDSLSLLNGVLSDLQEQGWTMCLPNQIEFLTPNQCPQDTKEETVDLTFYTKSQANQSDTGLSSHFLDARKSSLETKL